MEFNPILLIYRY